jgi:mannose-1-phosphate guanylyltransferase
VKGMILAAGFGSRLRPLTDRMPKPLLRVGGHPMIAYPLTILREAGIREVLINLHHLGDQIREAIGDGSKYGMSITYSEEDPILDTGGAIKKAEPFLRGGTFAVLNSDTVLDLCLADVVEQHRRLGALATMVLRPDRDAVRYGVIEIDSSRRIRRFLGRPAEVNGAETLTPLMFAGVHVFEPAVFSYMENGRFGINVSTYPRMMQAGCPLYGFVFRGYWRVLDTHAGLAEGRAELDSALPIAAARRPREILS